MDRGRDDWRWAAALAAILALAGVVRWELLGIRSLWYDEAYSLFVARMGPRAILEYLKEHDAHPAGYYLLLSGWIRAFGEELGVARLPSFAFGLTAVALTWSVARRLHSTTAAWVAALLVALHPFQVMASNELRMYAPLTVLVLTALLSALRAAGGGTLWGAWVGVLWAAVGYTSYYGLLAVAGMAVWLVAERRQQTLIVAAAVFLLLYLPWLPYLAGFWRVNPQLWTREPLWAGYPVELLAAQTFGGYWPETFTYHTSFRPRVLLYVPLVAPYLVLTAAAGPAARGSAGSGMRLAAWTWLAVHVGVLAASAAMGRAAAYPRHLTFVQPLAACWVAVGLVGLAKRLPVCGPVAVALGLVWLASLQGTALANMQSDPRYQTYRYDLAAAFVRSHFRPGDAVVYVPDGTSLAFEYYFRPQGLRAEVRVEPRAYRDEEWLPLFREALGPLGREHLRVWVVATSPGPPAGESALASALRELGYELVGHQVFPGLKVSLAVRRR